MIKLNEKNQKILITGGTGFIGSKLVKEFLKDGYKITVLTRKKLNHNKIKYINNLNSEFNYDIVINLCGETISQRWSERKKQEIYNSRINITKKITEVIERSNNPPSLVISGSAIGYYGTSDKLIFNEDSKASSQNLFSQKLCFDWEDAAKKISNKTRLVLIRTGVVVGKDGGIIAKMLLPFKFGFGGKIGSGNQFLSWISLKDLIGAINHIINNQDLTGAVNLTTSSVTTNLEFSKTLAKMLNRPCFFDVPEFAAKILFGQMAEELLLHGQNVYPKKLVESGYKFQLPTLKQAILESL